MKALVTGGGGFLGGALVAQLREHGHEVSVFGRNRYPQAEALGARCIQGDLADRAQVDAAVKGHDCVFHVAAKAGVWGSFKDYYDSNVRGTLHVLDACRSEKVPRLVYTSSPSVTFDGHDCYGSDERLPYPRKFLNPYSQTKAMAESMVLRSNGQDGLAVVALRPHLIWGPKDNHILPRVLRMARKGKLMQVGDGTNRVDITYVDDAARAHLLAAERLTGPQAPLAGKAYFLSQGDPVSLWPWINDLLGRLGLGPVKKRIPLAAAYSLGAALETAYRTFRLPGEPRMTRFMACQLGRSHYYNIQAARRDLGYEPHVGSEEGMRRTLDWLKTLG